jgi:GTP-binding protein YchF
MEWVDVAGLAKGAHRGEGLGNRFLGTLRDCTAVCHVVRAFEDPNVVHVDGKVDPIQDMEAIHLELLFADMAHVERRLEKNNVPLEERATLEQVAEGLEQGIPARALGLTKEAEFSIKSMGLLTLKPVMYAFNVDEVDYVLGRDEMTSKVQEIMQKLDCSYYDASGNDSWTLVSAKVEAELSLLSKEEQLQYLASLGVEDDDMDYQQLFSYNVLPTMAKHLLGLSVVYTGPGVPPERSKTTRAHLVSTGLTAEGLSGRLHGDIEKGFIRAEVTPAPILLDLPNYTAAKEAGCIRTEGREYKLDGDEVVLIKWK